MRSDAFPPAKLAIIPETTNLFGKKFQKQLLLIRADRKKGSLEKVCGYRSTIKILFCPFIKLNNG